MAALGVWLGAHHVVGALNNYLLTTFHPYPFSGPLIPRQDHYLGGAFQLVAALLPVIFTAPVLVVVVAQSYRHFRRDVTGQESAVIRRVAPILLCVLLVGVLTYAVKDFLFRPSMQQLMVLNEVQGAVGNLKIDVAKLDAANPMHLTSEDLAKPAPLSVLIQNWLRNATITVFPTERVITSLFAESVRSKVSPFYVNIRFSTGRECRTAGFYWWCAGQEDETREDFRRQRFKWPIIISDDVAQTVSISQVRPVLPREASTRDGAVVKLRILIDENGAVEWANPISGEEPFTSAAVAAVKRWRYEPISLLGRPAVAITNVTVTFP
jgi:hypothetical protein